MNSLGQNNPDITRLENALSGMTFPHTEQPIGAEILLKQFRESAMEQPPDWAYLLNILEELTTQFIDRVDRLERRANQMPPVNGIKLPETPEIPF